MSSTLIEYSVYDSLKNNFLDNRELVPIINSNSKGSNVKELAIKEAIVVLKKKFIKFNVYFVLVIMSNNSTRFSCRTKSWCGTRVIFLGNSAFNHTNFNNLLFVFKFQKFKKQRLYLLEIFLNQN